jgi:outer membrane lipoprotein
MSRWITRGVFILSLSMAVGCARAPVVVPEGAGIPDSSVRAADVRNNPASYRGRMVLWGGEVLQVIPQDDTRTLVEVAQMSLDKKQRPERKTASEDEFFILIEGARDFSQFERGKRITVAGEVRGTVRDEGYREVSGTELDSPVLTASSVHLWKEKSHPYSNPPDERGSWEYSHYSGILRY